MKKSIIGILGLLSSISGFAQTQPVYRITPWYEGKKAAVSLTFDDGLANQFQYALPKLNQFGFRSTFFVIANGAAKWDSIRSAASSGHEIGMHGTEDKNWVTALKNSVMTPQQVEDEISQSVSKINQEVTSQKVLTAAWPQGGGGGSSKEDSTVRSITRKYLAGGSRNASAGGNFDPYTQYTNSYFTAPGRNYYYQVGAYLMASSTSAKTMSDIIKAAIPVNGWFIPIYHAIETGGYANVTSDSLQKHLEAIDALKDSLWIVPFGTALRYHKENTSHTLTGVAETNDKWTLQLTDTLSDNSLFNQALTIRLKKPAFEIDSITQAGVLITYTETGDTLQFNAVPDGGDIVVFKKLATGGFPTVLKPAFYIYPNPTDGKDIRFSLALSNVYLTNTTGIKVAEYSGASTESISIKNLLPGIYILSGTTPGGAEIKERISIIK